MGRRAYKARYSSGGTANDPTIAIPELMHSMVVIGKRPVSGV